MNRENFESVLNTSFFLTALGGNTAILGTCLEKLYSGVSADQLQIMFGYQAGAAVISALMVFDVLRSTRRRAND